MKKRLFLFLSFLSFIVPSAFALADSDTKIVQFMKFNSDNNNCYTAAFDESGKILNLTADDASLFSSVAVNQPIDFGEAAADFLAKNQKLFDISDIRDLKIERISKSANISHIVFSQYHDGKNVYESGISVHLNAGGGVVMVNNSITRILESKGPVKETSIDAREASMLARRHMNCAALRGKVKISEIVFPENDTLRNAFRVEFPSKEPLGDFVCIIDAVNGEMLGACDIMKHQKAVFGTIYVNNPLKSKVTRESILNLNPRNAGLSGKWTDVINEDESPASADSSGNYIFDDSNTHFDEVNAYYHINKIHDYYSQFGFSGLDRPIKVIVHYGEKYDNAFFSPSEGMLAFGDGDRLNSLAREESIIYHEYTHAVTDEMVSMPYRGESGAMNEAFSDYFSCSITDDPFIGEWAMAKLNKPFLRNLDNKNIYPKDIQNEVHADSEIYGGALWDLRKALGKQLADKIIHFSRNYLKGYKNPKFADGLNSLLAADKEISGGKNSRIIVNSFLARGIKSNNSTVNGEIFKNMLKHEVLNGDLEAQKLLRNMEKVD